MIQFQRLHDKAILPSRGSEGAAGFDLYAAEEAFIGHREVIAVPTGIAVAIPDGYAGFIWPRSGLAGKGLDTMAGLVDGDYRGEIIVMLTRHADIDIRWHVYPGDRVAQIVFSPVLTVAIEVDELDFTQRGDAGFGSTGR